MSKSGNSSFGNSGIGMSRLTMAAAAVAVALAMGGLSTQPVVAQSGASKVTVCHLDSQLVFTVRTVPANAVGGHLSHGDGVPGGAVPGQLGYSFDVTCAAVLTQPDFTPFYIRNTNGSISVPWDSDMDIEENAEGDGFNAITPLGGQKVGYGTNFFDGIPLNTLESTNWYKVSGKAGIVSYLNIWVTDGVNYAIIASENDYRGTDFQTRSEWKVFETDVLNLDWLCATGPATRLNQYLQCNGANATLADIPVNVTILSPPSFPWSNVGTGAPRGGFGFNLIYGDTQSNFIGSYHLENLSITVGGMTFFAQ